MLPKILKISVVSGILLLIFVIIQLGWFTPGQAQPDHKEISKIGDIPVPEGFARTESDSADFASWLRSLPVRPVGTPVMTYQNVPWLRQDRHYAVVDLEIGDRGLQQCADVTIRLRSECLYGMRRYDDISFNFTSGDTASFRSWINGYRPVVKGNEVSWRSAGQVDSSYQAFKGYLDVIYTYCGTYSLSRQLKHKADPDEIEPGDIFVEGGFPGHAVMVADVAYSKTTDERIFLLLQGFTPAQDIHILINPLDSDLSPWYSTSFDDILVTPDWEFSINHLREF